MSTTRAGKQELLWAAGPQLKRILGVDLTGLAKVPSLVALAVATLNP